jgi:hypothetical protein
LNQNLYKEVDSSQWLEKLGLKLKPSKK